MSCESALLRGSKELFLRRVASEKTSYVGVAETNSEDIERYT